MKVDYVMFMSPKYLKDKYFYPFKRLQLLTFNFLEMSGFMVYVSKLLLRIEKQLGHYSISPNLLMITVRETILKTQ